MRIQALIALSCLLAAPVMSQEQLIPKPSHMSVTNSEPFTLDANTCIYVVNPTPELTKQAKNIQKILSQGTGLPLPIQSGAANAAPKNSISIELLRGMTNFAADMGSEGYAMRSTKDGITIIAGDIKGAFYAVSSIMQMLPVEFHTPKMEKSLVKWTVGDKGFEMRDEPRFGWRAFMLDDARYFHGVDAVKQLLDQMALLKMNIFHWGLTNDAGWRIEIKKYPKLTEVGGFRKNSEIGTWKSGRYSGKPHGGFYTQDQIREIVQYAADRNITILPEINMPGHSGAAATAYPHLSLKSPKETPIDFITNVALDPTKESTYEFISDVMDEVVALFPGPVIHFGGDEVRYNQQWRATPKEKNPYAPAVVTKATPAEFGAMPILPEIDAFMKKHKLKNFAEVQMVFSNRVADIIRQKGRRGMGWNEIYGIDLNHDGGGISEHKLDKNAIIHVWKGDLNHAKRAIQDGYTIVNGYCYSTYLDYSYGSISLEKAYNFEPVLGGLSPKEAKSVLGPSTQMWTEWTPTLDRMHYQAFPRIAAYAEVGWSQLDRKNYRDFKERLVEYLPIMDARGISYNKEAHLGYNRSDYNGKPVLGKWNSAQVNARKASYDATPHMKMKGDYTVAFFYDSGRDGATISSVSLLVNGEKVSSDTHEGFSGNAKRHIEYKLKLPEHKAGDKYTIEVIYNADAPMDGKSMQSDGTVYLAAPEVL